MEQSKKKKRHKRSYQYYIVDVLLTYGIVVQFIIVGFMGEVGNRFILGEYILSKEILSDASIMIGVMISVLLAGFIRRSIMRKLDMNPAHVKKQEQYCTMIVSVITMFLVEWVIAGVNLMLFPVWILMKKITNWQETLEAQKKTQQSQQMKLYVKEHIEQLSISNLCNLESLERKRFLLVLKQNQQSLGSRVAHGIISLGHRLANGFVFLVMGSLLCLLIYEGDINIGEALLYLFSLNSFISIMNVWMQMNRKKENEWKAMR